ncbi:hypothetical protein GTP38_07305 [Duganella sp. FT94W]|uniref:Uncharacterized protein n=1 Tax=Duganella lactea TaxID=2692173 RepID=A0ABW9V4E9_9BURK|nr:DUF6624 domain-containing protein [Duganella lactea]MYM34143.1 hypothetical protein [Duganella lactea]
MMNTGYRWRQLLLGVWLGWCAGLACAGPAEPALAEQLNAMRLVDQEVRTRRSDDQQAWRAEVERVDARHEAAMRDIIQRKGWPTEAMVGKSGVLSAWLLIQHASPQLLKQCLPGMQAAAERGELPWSEVALSVDRDLMYDGKPQRYGSQFQTFADGYSEMYKVEDEAHLDERRAKVGLPPIADYKAVLGLKYRD